VTGEIDPNSIAVRTFTAPTMSVKATNSPEWRAADLGALNGHSNARGVLDVMRVLSLGGAAGGVRLLSPETIEQVFRQQSDGVDLVLEAPFTWGIGYCLGSPVVPYVPAGRTFYWGGWGGSLVVMDLDRRLTISYMMNRMAPGLLGSARTEAYVRAVYAALG
jgi:CubicO group peptidase (beta-lactamase class C family)